MANSELSKLKILYLYDYFLHELNPFDDDSAVSMSDIIAYLKEKLGYTFERKSIYADISKINEFVSRTEKIKGDDSWIVVEQKKYRRNQVEDELTIDEARLLVDAINTTMFTDTSLCAKIQKMFPMYFDENYGVRALYPHDGKVDRVSISKLNNIRNAIRDRKVLNISYGYMLGKELVEKSTKTVSPIALDWSNNNYYLIAIDNSEVKGKNAKKPAEALRRYRLDRMAQVSFPDGHKDKYVSLGGEKATRSALKNFLDNSISAFSTDNIIKLDIVITSGSAKETLKAYNAFANKVGPAAKIDDSAFSKGTLGLSFNVADVPTLYTALFEIDTFDNVELKIQTENVRKHYARYIDKAMHALG